MLFRSDNLLETGLDGQYASTCRFRSADTRLSNALVATLHATFFESSAAHPPAPKADVIIPVSTLANNTGNDASVPPDFSVGNIQAMPADAPADVGPVAQCHCAPECRADIC